MAESLSPELEMAAATPPGDRTGTSGRRMGSTGGGCPPKAGGRAI